MTNFFPTQHISSSKKRRFGICDYPSPSTEPAYISEIDGKYWIAVVENYKERLINFGPIDHCIDLRKDDGCIDNRCDGCLFFNSTIIFVELKQRYGKGNQWIKDAEKQLRSTINHFEKNHHAFKVKKAYIANSRKPNFRSQQAERMERFYKETEYQLRIENRIEIL